MLLNTLLLLLPLLTPTLAAGKKIKKPKLPKGGSKTSSAAAAASSGAAVHDVEVGRDGLRFSPDNLVAAVGDSINFHFYPANHSVVQSSKDDPCTPIGSTGSNMGSYGGSGGAGVYSGFFPTSSGEASDMFSVTVSTTDAVYLYCSQARHCQSGMVMVLNPDEDDDVDDYKDDADDADNNVSPSGGVSGGVVMANQRGGSSGTSTASGSASSVSATGTSTASAASSTSTSDAGAVPARTGAVVGVILAAGMGAWALL